MTKNSQAKDVHQGIPFIRLIKVDFATDRRNSNAISVVRNSGHHLRKKSSIAFRCRSCAPDRAESQRVQKEYRARAHRKNVADNPSNAGCSALEWFDGTGMIVAFHLEGDAPTISNVDHSRVLFSGLHQNFRSGSRKFFEFEAGVLVRTMLAPHYR